MKAMPAMLKNALKIAAETELVIKESASAIKIISESIAQTGIVLTIVLVKDTAEKENVFADLASKVLNALKQINLMIL